MNINIDKSTEKNKNIKLILIGDTQCFGWEYNREKNNKLCSSIIKDHINKDKQIRGIIIPGDCTQTSEDGRYFITPNYMGEFYNHYWNDIDVNKIICTGNHDYDAENHTYDRMILYNDNPTINFINSLNNQRKNNIIDQDFKGNYLYSIDDLFILCLNTWPAPDDKLLLGGKPNGCLKFFENCAQWYLQHNKFIIVTHYIPNELGFDNENGFINWKTLMGTPCEAALHILNNHNIKNNLLCFVIGHIHLTDTFIGVNDDGIKIIIPPSPANQNYDGNICVINFDGNDIIVESTKVAVL